MITLDVILRTHDKRDVHVLKEGRYCKSDKTTLILKCVKSLVESCNNTDYGITYWWYDDNSSEKTLDQIREIFDSAKHPYNFTPIEEHGWNASAYYQFDCGRKSTADLVYLIEDDYLHFPTAISEMVESYIDFKEKLGRDVAIHPFDDPDNYLPQWIEPCRIVYGTKRHWRTNYYTTNTVMCSPDVIRRHWSKWYTLATEYGTVWSELRGGNIHEGTTINRIWRDEVSLFTPIPSVALHMGFEGQRDPYLDWQSLWDSFDV